MFTGHFIISILLLNPLALWPFRGFCVGTSGACAPMFRVQKDLDFSRFLFLLNLAKTIQFVDPIESNIHDKYTKPRIINSCYPKPIIFHRARDSENQIVALGTTICQTLKTPTREQTRLMETKENLNWYEGKWGLQAYTLFFLFMLKTSRSRVRVMNTLENPILYMEKLGFAEV